MNDLTNLLASAPLFNLARVIKVAMGLESYSCTLLPTWIALTGFGEREHLRQRLYGYLAATCGSTELVEPRMFDRFCLAIAVVPRRNPEPQLIRLASFTRSFWNQRISSSFTVSHLSTAETLSTICFVPFVRGVRER
jgi:hypothetical protein